MKQSITYGYETIRDTQKGQGQLIKKEKKIQYWVGAKLGWENKLYNIKRHESIFSQTSTQHQPPNIFLLKKQVEDD